MRWKLNDRLALRICVLVSVAAGCFAVSGWLAVDANLAHHAEAFRTRSVLYALAISGNLQAWIGTEDRPDPSLLAQYALLSDIGYLQVVSAGRTLLDLSPPMEEGSSANSPAESTWAPGIAEIAVDGRPYIDVVLPYGPLHLDPEDRGPYDTGFVRIGIDAAEVQVAAARVRSLALWIGLAAWIVVSVSGGMLIRRTFGCRTATSEDDSDQSRRVLAGARTLIAPPLVLHLDETRLSVGEHSIRITPKQRDVLSLLFHSPGRAFSDAEILAAAWSDSSYADSRDVKQYIYLIRRRLSAAGLPGDRVLENVPGIGYRLVPEAATSPVDPNVDSPSIDNRPSDAEGLEPKVERSDS